MKRIERIKNRLFEDDFMKKKQWWGEAETILDADGVKEKPLIVRKSLAVHHVARKMPIDLRPDELIVGVPTMASVGFGKCFPSYASDVEKAEAAKHSYTEKSVFGHHPANFKKLLQLGLSGIRSEIFDCLNDKQNDREAVDFYTSVLISLDAVEELAHRYTILLMEKANRCEDPKRRRELFQMASVCSRVPENPAFTLHEALQSIWTTFCIFHSTMEFIPIGRSDQYLYPYYEQDKKVGRITDEQAEELIGSWLAKFGERVHLNPEQWEVHISGEDVQFNGADPSALTADAGYDNDESYNYGTSANHWLINMIVGGQTPDGKDAANPLTYMILQQWNYLQAVVPVMSVRLHKGSPKKLYNLCAEILLSGTSGEPVLYNDDAIIPGMIKLGFSQEDAYDYANDGCWETLVPGKTNFAFCDIQLLQLLEYMMQDGRSLVRKRKERNMGKRATDYHSYEEFYTNFLLELEMDARGQLKNKLARREARYRIAPSPLLSALMDDSIQRGKEYSAGGAKYDVFGYMVCGLASCIDSLAVIRSVVFDEKHLGLDEFAQILADDFAGHEAFRQKILNRVPKFGNDEEAVDEIAKRFLDDFASIIARLQKEFDDIYILEPGIATFEMFAVMGHQVGASADGRHAQQPLGSNFSPAIGMDKSGPTAVIRSVTKPNLLPYAIGAPLDIQIDPEDLPGEQGQQRLVGLVRSFMDLGGLILTITGVSKKTMEEAQKHPEKHKNLRVRLGGLSAYFISLSKTVQDSLIERSKHTL